MATRSRNGTAARSGRNDEGRMPKDEFPPAKQTDKQTDIMTLQERIQQSIEDYEAEAEDHRALVRIHEARVDLLEDFIEELKSLQLAAEPHTPKAKPARKAKAST